MSGPRRGAGAAVEHRTIRRVALLVNPAAGSGRGLEMAREAASLFVERGIDVEVLRGADAAHSRELAGKAVADPSVDALVVCGGDGLINLAVQRQAGTGTPLGVIPAGTGNDLARELGIPINDTARAVQIVAAGQAERTDLGRVRGDAGADHLFASIACCGLDSAVNRLVNQLRVIRGPLRYVLAAARVFPGYRASRYRMVFDGDELVERPLMLVAVGNTRYYGGGMEICPEADHGDGKFDVTWLEDVPKWRAAIRFRRVFSGTHLRYEGVGFSRCRSVRIELADSDAGDVDVYADGDFVTPLPATVDVLSGAGLFLVP